MSYSVQPRASSQRFLRNKRHTVQRITKLEHKKLSHLWDESARAFLRAIVLSDIIRVDTGMSKASLLPLARYLRMYTEVRSTISPKGDKKGAFDVDGAWHPEATRGTALGEASSTRRAGYNVLYGSPKRMVFVFDFEIRVWQYLIYEQGLGKGKAWATIDTGRAAFQEYLENNFKLFDLREWGLHG